jgi:hypothetical protein
MTSDRYTCPVIFLPGIKGSRLINSYHVHAPDVWNAGVAASNLGIAHLHLDPEGLADRHTEMLVKAQTPLEIPYRAFIEGLRGRSCTPVFPFGYDWRVSLGRSAQELVEFVFMLRTKDIPELLGWKDSGRSFHFACHSMGGLLFRAFVAAWSERFGELAPVESVAYIGTPHAGSLEMVETMTRHRNRLFFDDDMYRKVSRSFPAAYELLPAYDNALIDRSADAIWNLSNWQDNVTKPPEEEQVTEPRLKNAKKVRQSMVAPDDISRFATSPRELRVLNVFGVGERTSLGVPIISARGQTVFFNFDGMEEMDNDDRHMTDAGDGTVAERSAKMGFSDAFAAHCIHMPIPRRIMPRWRDPVNVGIGFHAALPRIDDVQSLVHYFFRHQQGEFGDHLPWSLR